MEVQSGPAACGAWLERGSWLGTESMEGAVPLQGVSGWTQGVGGMLCPSRGTLGWDQGVGALLLHP